MLKSVLAISAGASMGAVLRWVFGLVLNALFPLIPMGTLAANLLGGYGVGLAVSFFAASPGFAPDWRLFVITGFLGGLTTFSTFSAEVTELLQQGRLGWACGAVSMHLFGSLLMTFLGMGTFALFKHL